MTRGVHGTSLNGWRLTIGQVYLTKLAPTIEVALPVRKGRAERGELSFVVPERLPMRAMRRMPVAAPVLCNPPDRLL